MSTNFFPYDLVAEVLNVKVEHFPNKVILTRENKITFYQQGTARPDDQPPKVMSALKALKVAIGVEKFENL